ncbi:MAG: DNA2/NAM7 family helicase [Bacteroidota bacterium]|nr:DNA2/NAM7 family helicase [Bacteroidota bacterium]
MTLWNFFSNKVENRIIISGSEELINDFLPYIPIPDDKAKDVLAKLSIYQKEKELFYCSLFLVGHGDSSIANEKRICSPLFFYPAVIIEKNSFYYLQIDFSKRRFNHSILSLLNVKPGVEEKLNEFFYNELPESPFEYKEIGIISRIFQKYFNDIETSELTFFPQLMDEKRIKKEISQLKNKNTFAIIPASGIGVIKKSTQTIGVLNELLELSNSQDFSGPLNSLLGEKHSEKPSVFYRGLTPAILSDSQEKIIQSASINELTYVIGPPGTGKSFTLATLAIEHMSKGKSVLIASKNDTAVDVIGDKIEEQLFIKNVLTRAGRKDYKSGLKNRLSDIIKGIGNYSYNPEQIKELEFELKATLTRITVLEKEFNSRVDTELGYGKFLKYRNESKALSAKFYRRYIHWRNISNNPHWVIIKELEDMLDEKIRLTSALINLRFIRQISFARTNHKNELQNFLNGIRSRTGVKKEELFDNTNFRKLLTTFPIWLVKFSDIYDVLPLHKELFDLVIIDEATQCDISSCLPVIQRGKRVVIAGDPKQLRHISFLSNDRQNQIAHENNGVSPEKYNYRNKSLIDFIEAENIQESQTLFLDEHYRSAPPIISFSNKEFYNNSLRIMKEIPEVQQKETLFHIGCLGSRNKDGSNVEEAEKIVQHVMDIVRTEKEFDINASQSIGILSPFRAQADLVFSKISSALTLNDIQKHKIMIGTAHSFQGEERDVMMISFALDDNSHFSAFRFFQKPDVFNVSITRARSLQYIYTSFDYKKLNPDFLVRKYIEQVVNGTSYLKKSNVSYDVFCQEVKTELENKSFHTWINHPVAGLSIDILFNCGQKTYGIDLIGYPGEFKESFTLERYKMLNRAGLSTFPLPYSYWLKDKARCMEEVAKWIK